MPSNRSSHKRFLTEVFRRIHSWARQESGLVPRLSFRVGCPVIARHRRTDPRAYCHVGGHGRTHLVCCSPAVAELPFRSVCGLLLHEIGHPLATRAYGRTEQEDADKACMEFLGVRIRYQGPHLIEFVSARDVRKILGAR